jgi:hypothetical protein
VLFLKSLAGIPTWHLQDARGLSWNMQWRVSPWREDDGASYFTITDINVGAQVTFYGGAWQTLPVTPPTRVVNPR